MAPSADANVSSARLAFGRRAVPQLTEEAASSSVDVRNAAITAIASLSHDPLNVSEGVACGLVPRLLEVCQQQDSVTRLKATEVFSIYSGHASGRAILIRENALLILMNLCEDKNSIVRIHIHTTLRNVLANPHEGFDVLQDAPHLINVLIDRLKCNDETFTIQTLILETLYYIICQSPDSASITLKLKCFDIIKSKLQSRIGGTQLRVQLAKCIMALCSIPEGRTAAMNCNIPKLLAEQLNDLKPQARSAIAGAIMTLSIDVSAKQEFVLEDTVSKLIDLLTDEDKSVCLNVLRAITSLSEDYRARFTLQDALPMIEAHQKSKDMMIRKAADRAVEVVNWRP